MSMKWTYCLPTLLALCLLSPTASHADSPPPSEPGDGLLIEHTDDSVARLLFRDYSLQGNDHADYRTARHIPGISYDDPASEEADAALHPLFYRYDPHQDGR